MRSPSPPPPAPYPCPLDSNEEAGGRGGAALIPNTASSLLTFLYKYKYIVQLCGVWGESGGYWGAQWPLHTSHLTRLLLAAQGASCDGGGEWRAVSHHHRVVRVTPPPPAQLMQRKSRVQRWPWPGPGPPLQHAALCSAMQHYAGLLCSAADSAAHLLPA